MEQNEEIKTSVLSYDVTDLLAHRPGHQMGLRAVASICAAAGSTHRYDVNTTLTTTTLQMELSQRNVLVEAEVGRNPTSGTSATPSTFGRIGNTNSTNCLKCWQIDDDSGIWAVKNNLLGRRRINDHLIPFSPQLGSIILVTELNVSVLRYYKVCIVSILKNNVNIRSRF